MSPKIKLGIRTCPILFLTYHYPPEVGGIQTTISKYVSTLTRFRYPTTVVYILPSKRINSPIPSFGSDLILLRGGLVRHGINTFILLRQLLKRKGGVVHIFSGVSTLLSLTTLLLARLLSKRTAVSFYGSEDFAFTGIINRAIHLLSIQLSDRILVNSKATSTHLPKKYLSKCTVLYGGANSRPLPIHNDRYNVIKRILFVGRLVKRKGIDDLIQAFIQVSTKMNNVELVIVGDGPERKNLEDILSSNSLISRVKFTGKVTDEELNQQYSKADVIVLPSKRV